MEIRFNDILNFLKQETILRNIEVNQEKLRIDILDKKEILSIYQLRLQIANEKANLEGIKMCKEIITILSNMKGQKLYSVFYKDNVRVNSFIDQDIKTIYIFPSDEQ